MLIGTTEEPAGVKPTVVIGTVAVRKPAACTPTSLSIKQGSLVRNTESEVQLSRGDARACGAGTGTLVLQYESSAEMLPLHNDGRPPHGWRANRVSGVVGVRSPAGPLARTASPVWTFFQDSAGVESKVVVGTLRVHGGGQPAHLQRGPRCDMQTRRSVEPWQASSYAVLLARTGCAGLLCGGKCSALKSSARATARTDSSVWSPLPVDCLLCAA